MSVRHSILTLLYSRPRHGYDIKISFDEMVHHQWNLNVGQIYTTLDRLVRDGLVEPLNAEHGEKKEYQITQQGREELYQWLIGPVERSLLKDEFYFKLLCAKQIQFHQEEEMIRRQKEMILRNMLQMRALRTQLDPVEDHAMILLVEGAILHLEADLKWLEL
ncbi:PadR family transcriptional regulator [Rubeoparvulum massiliense]|uniref:PadR family transcriptional regulator n=1 Tax=Rubeoparvulum massiliense TaxID=1631346 RepID=UPI00065E6D5E|nr:PadR family transcriptional regulator [Rubeoparvulum massiliense]